MYFDSERETISGTLFTSYSATPVYWSNKKFNEEDTPEYIHPIIQSGQTNIISVAGNSTSYRRFGIVMFQIFVPKGSGTKRPRQIAHKLTPLFIKNKIDDITFLNADFMSVGDVEDKFQCNMILGYQWDKCA